MHYALCIIHYALFNVLKHLVERFLRELHHLVAFSPRVQSALQQWRRQPVGHEGHSCTQIIHGSVAKDHVHALAHQFLLLVGRAKIVELLAPLVNLVSQVNLHGTNRLAA